MGKEHVFSVRRERNHEIDIIVSGGDGPVLAFGCKTGKVDVPTVGMRRFKEKFPNVLLVFASMNDDKKRKIHDFDILPWQEVLQLYRSL